MTMTKTEALRAFDGNQSKLARAIGVTPQAVIQWPEELTDMQRDRVQAALFRIKLLPRTRKRAPRERDDIGA